MSVRNRGVVMRWCVPGGYLRSCGGGGGGGGDGQQVINVMVGCLLLFRVGCSAFALTVTRCVICLLVLESGTVRVCRCSGGEIHDSCWIALQLARRGSSLCCPQVACKCLCRAGDIFSLRR